MSELTQNLRRIIESHDKIVPETILKLMLGEMEKLESQVAQLRDATLNQYTRQGEQIVALRKEVDRLKGVHGA